MEKKGKKNDKKCVWIYMLCMNMYMYVWEHDICREIRSILEVRSPTRINGLVGLMYSWAYFVFLKASLTFCNISLVQMNYRNVEPYDLHLIS